MILIITDSSNNANKRFVLLTVEWIRLFLREVSESFDTVTILFDMTGFSLLNADYVTVKFLAECLEAHYPESLGSILIHCARWIFSSVCGISLNIG